MKSLLFPLLDLWATLSIPAWMRAPTPILIIIHITLLKTILFLFIHNSHMIVEETWLKCRNFLWTRLRSARLPVRLSRCPPCPDKNLSENRKWALPAKATCTRKRKPGSLFPATRYSPKRKQLKPHETGRAPRPGCTKTGVACKRTQADPIENPIWSSPQSSSSSSAPSSLPLVKPPWRLKLFKQK
jgi:hypothetical protein